jgi:hypothetical protein
MNYNPDLKLIGMRVKCTIEFELDESFGIVEDDLLWLENEVLVGDGNLILHSNDVGDSVGVVKLVRNIQYITNKPKPKTIV